MSIGTSGRIVIEIDPDLKKDLYEALDKEGLKLKQWFLENANQFLSNKAQLGLDITNDDQLVEEASA